MRSCESTDFNPFEQNAKVLANFKGFSLYDTNGDLHHRCAKLLADWVRKIKKQEPNGAFRPCIDPPAELAKALFDKFPAQAAMFIRGMACTGLDWCHIDTKNITSSTSSYTKNFLRLIFMLCAGMPNYLRYASVFEFRQELAKVLRSYTFPRGQSNQPRMFEEFWDGYLTMSEKPVEIGEEDLPESLLHVVQRKDDVHSNDTVAALNKMMEMVMSESTGAIRGEDGSLKLAPTVESKMRGFLAVSKNV